VFGDGSSMAPSLLSLSFSLGVMVVLYGVGVSVGGCCGGEGGLCLGGVEYCWCLKFEYGSSSLRPSRL